MPLFAPIPSVIYSDTRFTDSDFALAWGDVDSDGFNELLVAPFTITPTDQPVFLTYTGTDFSDKNIVISDGGFANTTGAGFEIFDIDNDGQKEVLFLNNSDALNQILEIWRYSDGALRQTATNLSGFTDIASITDISAVKISDINYLFAVDSTTVQVAIYNLSDVTAAPTIFSPPGAPPLSGVSVRDIDCDGQLEMALSAYPPFFPNTVVFFRLVDPSDLTVWIPLCDFLPILNGAPLEIPQSVVFANLSDSCQWDLIVTDQATVPANIAVYQKSCDSIVCFGLATGSFFPIVDKVCCRGDIVAFWTLNSSGATCSDDSDVGFITLTRPSGDTTVILQKETTAVTFSFSDCQVGSGSLTFFRKCAFCSDFSDSFTIPLDFVDVTVDAGSDQTIAAGSDTVIGVGSAEVNVLYTWSPTDGVSDASAFPTIVTPSDTTTYTVIAERTDVPPGCIASDSVTITVISASDCVLSVDAGSDQTVCKGSTVTLGVGSALSDVSYVWSPSDGITNIYIFPTIANVCNSQNYTVTATRVNNSDCASSDSVLITVSDCSDASNLSSYSDNVTFFQSCKNCPTVNISIKHKTNSVLTLDEFFSSDGSDVSFDDSMFISSYTPVKKNIGVNKSYGSDLGFGYACYTYSNGLTVVRQENGDIILVNNGDINIDSPIDLTNAFHFGDWIGPSDSVSSDKKQPDLILMSNKGSVNINQDVTVPGLVTCMAPNGHVRVACNKILTSTNNRVVIMASDNNHGGGTVNAFITDSLPSGSPSSDTLTITLTDTIFGSDIINTSDTITVTTNKNVVISSDSTITKNLIINTPASVTTKNITANGKHISIAAGYLYTSDIDTSNISSSDGAEGGSITLLSQNEIFCRNLSTSGGARGVNGSDAIESSDADSDGGSGGVGGMDGDGGVITLVAGTSIIAAAISANGGSTGGAGGSGGNFTNIIGSDAANSSDAISNSDAVNNSDAIFGESGSVGGSGGDGGIDGDGGIITLIAGLSITTTSISANGGSTGGVGGDGGSGSSGSGSGSGDGGADGDGGIISLIAGTSITTAVVSANGGSTGGAGGGSSGSSGGEGEGGTDGDGGIISFIAGTSITTVGISANGGSTGGPGGEGGSTGGVGGTDGDGGTITLIAGTEMIIGVISTNGGSEDGVGSSSSVVNLIRGFLDDSTSSENRDGDGGAITLIACGDITVEFVPATVGSVADHVVGKILIKSYGSITGAPASTSDIQIVRMRDLQLKLLTSGTVFSQGSDVTFTLNIVNQGSLVKPATTITIGVAAVSTSDVFIFPETKPQTFTLSDLLPGLSDSFTTTVTNLTPGKFMYTAVMPDACVSDVYFVNVAGSTTVGKLELTMTGSLLSLTFYMPDYFNQAFPGVTDFKTLLSDMCVYSQSSDLIMGLEVADQSDVFNSDAVILQGRRNVRIECSDDGNVLFAKATNGSYVLGLFNYASDPLIVFYSDKIGPLVNKTMNVVSDSFSTITVTQPGADLDIVSVAPSDIEIKLNGEASFDVMVKNNSPIDVADAFIRITSNLNEMFSDKFIGFLPSDGTLISDTITITPTAPGHHVLSFEIDSTAVVNTNTVTNIFGDVLLDVCQLDIAMTTNGSIVVFPNFPFSVPFDLTKAGGNPTAHVTAKISDVVHHQQDFAAGSHTIVVSPPKTIDNNTIIKLEASDKSCFDTDFHVIQVIDSLEDVADLLGTTFSDIKNILSANDPFAFVERLFGVSNVLPRLPDNLIDRIWDVPIFTKFLPALGDLLADLSSDTTPPPPPPPSRLKTLIPGLGLSAALITFLFRFAKL